ncbi:MAG TPA: efflux transporter periplasmic adaptor subunit [Algoriphagus sp.]|jgi:membrane fusion protein (multidrug efflux system)|uniref:efflux RND transporter periplasmic adaptor subunit n=1 Tax=unclassified Algoriphagus TaxID=2641541 RepID=UPI000C3A5DA4|nr:MULTISPECIES: efflux RND transporter periplasmic adaptor subunit [unclassified Algoriphagus]MAL12989.1 efflux transporter periplasmic adaptor subunit [Algoriphagus sp.]QYH39348.1 efflux RND transporter periplasmic adaptor subunit [Algoriphagus sp. NBT04N3]HAD53291.1 efflux transporter periplasmic adaptor subunit [Algoriphagus sp.]HAH36449.1 efflux transporter periplasmic adaptor subunit [Algoriphagus sp.]HAS60560.1 efflux transporter periplasmic adaptor subunit [Algoriphagus sp.]|tara:strand:- start:10260 stop:11450 length:1191 start_codon:yes stop_codon:yes gene_type:complete
MKTEKQVSFSKGKTYAKILLSITILSALVVGINSCTEVKSKNTTEKEEPLIPILELQPQTVEVPQTYICDIQAIQFVEVRSKVEGFVNQIFVDEGQHVKKGQKLFQLSSAEYNELVNSARANLMKAKAEEKAAKVERERLLVLVEKNIISKSELELANSKLSVAESQIAEAEAQLKGAQMGLSYTTVKAPFDGIVDRIPHKIGSLVNENDLLTSITDISSVFAYYKVNESEYLSFMRTQIEGNDFSSLDDKLSLILSDGEKYPEKGRLETTEGDIEEKTGSIGFRVRFPNPDKLIKHGASGKIQMMSNLTDVFLIPQKATFEIQDFTYVYVVDKENVVKVRSFKPLQRMGVYYIAQGFEPGDRIVLEGIQQLQDGAKILPQAIAAGDVYSDMISSN